MENLIIRCSIHNLPLNIVNNENGEIFVEPCKECLNEEYDHGLDSVSRYYTIGESENY